MPEPIAFSNQQVSYIKRCLTHYIHSPLSKGERRRRSISHVVDRINDNDSSQCWLQADGSEQLITSNILNKWLHGELVLRGRGGDRRKVRHFTYPQPARLMAIYEFLKSEGQIDENILGCCDAPFSSLALKFLRFSNGVSAETPSAQSQVQLDRTGDYYALEEAGAAFKTYKLSLDRIHDNGAYFISLRVRHFRRTASTVWINIEAPLQTVLNEGWGVVTNNTEVLFVRRTDNSADVEIFSRTGIDGLSNVRNFYFSRGRNGDISFGDIDFLFEKLRKLEENIGSFKGKRIKLLRNTYKRHVKSCIFDYLSDIERLDLDGFEHFVVSGGDVNAISDEGRHILHYVAGTLNRPALKILMKREDLDYLSVGDVGYFPSFSALNNDPSSSIFQFLRLKEIQQAQRQNEEPGSHYVDLAALYEKMFSLSCPEAKRIRGQEKVNELDFSLQDPSF